MLRGEDYGMLVTRQGAPRRAALLH